MLSPQTGIQYIALKNPLEAIIQFPQVKKEVCLIHIQYYKSISIDV